MSGEVADSEADFVELEGLPLLVRLLQGEDHEEEEEKEETEEDEDEQQQEECPQCTQGHQGVELVLSVVRSGATDGMPVYRWSCPLCRECAWSIPSHRPAWNDVPPEHRMTPARYNEKVRQCCILLDRMFPNEWPQQGLSRGPALARACVMQDVIRSLADFPDYLLVSALMSMLREGGPDGPHGWPMSTQVLESGTATGLHPPGVP